MKQIQSVHNQYIKAAKQLKLKKYRDKTSLFLVEGERLIEEALQSNYPLEFSLIAGEVDPGLIEKLEQKCPTFSVSPELLDAVSETENSQGILAVARQKKISLGHLDSAEDEAFLMVVDGVQDPGNLGTIIRTAAAVGVDGMILTATTVDLYNSKTVRSSMGSMFYIPIITGETPEQVSLWLTTKGFKIVTGHVAAEKLYQDFDYQGKVAIVVGNENYGPSQVFKASGFPVRIPCRTESLNVSVAAAILLYERIRNTDNQWEK